MEEIKIKDVLKKNGFSYAGVATQLGMGKQNFGQQLDRSPSFDLIKRISRVTGISLEELAGLEDGGNNITITCPKCGTKLDISINVIEQ